MQTTESSEQPKHITIYAVSGTTVYVDGKMLRGDASLPPSAPDPLDAMKGY